MFEARARQQSVNAGVGQQHKGGNDEHVEEQALVRRGQPVCVVLACEDVFQGELLLCVHKAGGNGGQDERDGLLQRVGQLAVVSGERVPRAGGEHADELVVVRQVEVKVVVEAALGAAPTAHAQRATRATRVIAGDGSVGHAVHDAAPEAVEVPIPVTAAEHAGNETRCFFLPRLGGSCGGLVRAQEPGSLWL